MFNIYVKTGFGIKYTTMVDIPENQTELNQIYLYIDLFMGVVVV